MGLDRLPQKIKDDIMGIGKEKDSYYDLLPNEVHVTELLYCLRKAHFKRFNPRGLTLQEAFYNYRGNLMDERWTNLFRKNQIRCTHRVPNALVSIVGKLDFIDDESGELVICDLKTTKNLYFLVSERYNPERRAKAEHEAQVKFYCHCNSIAKAKVFYMDFGDVADFEVNVTETNDLLKTLEERATVLYNSFIFHCEWCKGNLGLKFTEGMICPHCNNVVSEPYRVAPPVNDNPDQEWLCQVRNKKTGEVTYQCPYYDRCFTTEIKPSLPVSLEAGDKVSIEAEVHVDGTNPANNSVTVKEVKTTKRRN